MEVKSLDISGWLTLRPGPFVPRPSCPWRCRISNWGRIRNALLLTLTNAPPGGRFFGWEGIWRKTYFHSFIFSQFRLGLSVREEGCRKRSLKDLLKYFFFAWACFTDWIVLLSSGNLRFLLGFRKLMVAIMMLVQKWNTLPFSVGALSTLGGAALYFG